MAPRARAAGIGLALCLLLGAPGSVAGAEPQPTPSAQELLDAYPLHATPDPGTRASPAPRATATRRVSAAAASSDGGGSFVPPLLAAIVLVTGAVALLWTFRPSRRYRGENWEPDRTPASEPLAAVPAATEPAAKPLAALPAPAKPPAAEPAAKPLAAVPAPAKPPAAEPAAVQTAAPETVVPPPAAPKRAAAKRTASKSAAEKRAVQRRSALQQRDAAKLAAAKPAAAKRAAAKPAAAKAAAAKRAAAKPAAAKPAAAKPAAAEQPATSKPAARRRAATQKRDAAKPAASPSQQPAATRNGDADTRPSGALDEPRRIAPPDRRRRWVAEVRWVESASAACFVVRAGTAADGEGVVIAQSSVLEWPPAGPATVEALTAAVAELERGLLAAGWTALPTGSEWYAKRFAWQPGVAAAQPPPRPAASRSAPAPPRAPARPRSVAPAPAPAPAREQQRPGRFMRRAGWPEGSERLWRCELRWQAGVRKSRFEALAYDPRTRSARPVLAGAAFKWQMKSDPDSAGQEYRTAVRALAILLQADGWERAGQGAKWYSARFVWRRPGTPPDHLEPAAPRTERAP